jgi:hypothetical protein
MGNKQILAQVGVFALLGLNVGAYYVFWPHKESAAQGETKPVAQSMPIKKDGSRPLIEVLPKETPNEDGVRTPLLQIANPPSQSLKPAERPDEDESIRRLLQNIKKDDVKKEAGDIPLPNPPRQVNEEPRPTNLSPVEKVAVTPALTPRMAPGPWALNMEMVGGQTQLIARLKQATVDRRPMIEFKILCDRVEVKAPGAVQAIGKVTVIGAGLKGTCQRLTLPLHETQLIFEEQAKIVQDANPGSSLSGERVVWELAPIVEPQPTSQQQPVDPRPFNLYPLNPPSLGQPN